MGVFPRLRCLLAITFLWHQQCVLSYTIDSNQAVLAPSDDPTQHCGTVSATVTDIRPNAVVWGACANHSPPLQCADFAVPANHDNPTGPTITLGLMKLPASGPGPRKGSIVYLPGGPGGLASAAPFELAVGSDGWKHYFAESRKQYDILGIDPRGLGLSQHIECDDTKWNAPFSFFPTTPAEYLQLTTHNNDLGRSCGSGPNPPQDTGILKFLNTVTIAKDIEAVRVGLNETKFSFFGDSYGTFTGLTYLERFGGSIQYMVLDGITDHTRTSAQKIVEDSASAVEQSFTKWAAWCRKAKTSECAWSANPEDNFDKLVQLAQKTGLPAVCTVDAPCKTPVDDWDLLLSMQTKLSTLNEKVPSTFEKLSAELASAHVDAASFASPHASSADDGIYTIQAMLCADWSHDAKSLDDIQKLVQAAAAKGKHTRGASIFLLTQTACLNWPYPTSFREAPLVVPGAQKPPVLLISSQSDPATPLDSALNVQSQISASSLLMVRDGSGHGSYRNGGAINKAVEAFFVNGTVPMKTGVSDPYPD